MGLLPLVGAEMDVTERSSCASNKDAGTQATRSPGNPIKDIHSSALKKSIHEIRKDKFHLQAGVEVARSSQRRCLCGKLKGPHVDLWKRIWDQLHVQPSILQFREGRHRQPEDVANEAQLYSRGLA